MIGRTFPFVVAFSAVLAACGSDDAAPVDTLPNSATTTTVAPSTAPPITVVAVTDPPIGNNGLDPAEAQAQLDAAAARWDAQGLTSYTIVTQQLCFCPEQEWSDTVVDGEVTEHAALTDGAFFDPGPATMLSLFTAVQTVIDEGYATLDLEFDPRTGALIRYFVDINRRMADEESGIEVLSLKPIS